MVSDGWASFGGNLHVKSDRLLKLGWKPIESKKHAFFDSLKESLEVALLQ